MRSIKVDLISETRLDKQCERDEMNLSEKATFF